MNLLAHGGAGFINTWGFAYTFGVIGLVSTSLLYVSGKISKDSCNDGSVPKPSLLAAAGRGVIIVGGLCGVSIGLGIAGLVEPLFGHDVEVREVVAQLCRSIDDRSTTDDALHDDIEHVIDDVDAEVARTAHQRLHDAAEDERDLSIDRLVGALIVADGQGTSSCDELSSTTADSS